MGNLHNESRFYKSTLERTDVYNEIHSKLVDLNLQMMLFDQQLQKLIQNCNEDQVQFLKAPLQSLVKDQQNIKMCLTELLVRLFKHKCINIPNLRGFVLEQEVYRLLGTIKNLEGFKYLITNIEGLRKAVDKRHKRLQGLKMKQDQVPTTLWDVGEASHGSRSRSQCQSQPVRISRKEKSVRDVVVELYGFPICMALDIHNCIASQRMVKEVGPTLDSLDFLDHQFLSENCEKEDPETENWKHLRKWRQDFECMNLENVGSGSGSDHKSKILEVIKHWVFHIESVLWYQVYNVYSMMSSFGPCLRQFRELELSLKERKKNQNGMVPIIVYKILAMLNTSVQAGRDKTELWEEIEFDRVMYTFDKIILYVGFVLNKTSNARVFDRRMLISCQTALYHSEEFLKAIDSRIYRPKCRLELVEQRK